MFKKLLTAIAATAALCATAQAQVITNAGFEANGGSKFNWDSNPELTAVPSATIPFSIFDPQTQLQTSFDITINPVEGTHFGLFVPVDLDNPGAQAPFVPSTASAGVFQTDVWNFGSGTGVTAPETVWLRLLTLDVGSADFNDRVSVAFSGVGTSYTIQGQYMSSVDSGWIGFAVPTGATGLQVNVFDTYGGGIGNSPTVAIDYSLSAIPEPTSVLMMLAGLGALGFKGRRALGAKRNAAAAA